MNLADEYSSIGLKQNNREYGYVIFKGFAARKNVHLIAIRCQKHQLR